MGFTDVTYGAVAFDALSYDTHRRPKNSKHTLGTTVVFQGPGLGTTALERVIKIRGRLRGTISARDALRASIKALEDGQKHALVNGIHNGNYVINPQTLVWFDSGSISPTFYEFDMELVEW